VKGLWNDADAACWQGDLGQRVYTSRLLGREPSLVLHGGGNTSVKISEPDALGTARDVLYVKGSGWDLASIEAAGFAPVVMDHLLRLATLDRLSDERMVNELATHVTRACARSMATPWSSCLTSCPASTSRGPARGSSRGSRILAPSAWCCSTTACSRSARRRANRTSG